MRILKPFVGLAGVGLFIYLCVMLVPPFLDKYQFEDFLDQEARQTSYSNLTEDAIRNEVLKEARKDDLPITADQIKITRAQNYVSISVDYTIHVDLPVFPQDFHFSVASKNRAI